MTGTADRQRPGIEWPGRRRSLVAQYTPWRPVHRTERAGTQLGSRGNGGDPRFAHERSRRTMDVPRCRIPTALVLLTGVVLGWILASFRPAPARAGAGGRSGETIVRTGP